MSEKIEQQILAHEEQLIQAKRTLDLDALQRIYADDVLITGVLGEPTCSKPAIIEEIERGKTQRDSAIASGKSFATSCDNEDLKVATYGETAVTTYRFVVKVRAESLDINRKYRVTHVWAKRKGNWQIVTAHTALVLDAKQLASLVG